MIDAVKAWKVLEPDFKCAVPGEVTEVPVDGRHTPNWLSPALTWLGAFAIIATAISFFVLELYLVSDAWFLLAILVMAGISLIAIGRRMRNNCLPEA